MDTAGMYSQWTTRRRVPRWNRLGTPRASGPRSSMVESRRWMAMEGDEVVGSVWAAFRRPDAPDTEDHARFLWASGGVRASYRRRGMGNQPQDFRLTH